MAILRFEPEGVEIERVAPGTRLVDVTDAHPETEVPFSCRSASCGTCRVEVVEGVEALSAPDAEELDVLEIFGDEPGVRLCCQIVLERDVPRLVLRVVDPY
jgi:2Fe-2S ferredoxin